MEEENMIYLFLSWIAVVLGTVVFIKTRKRSKEKSYKQWISFNLKEKSFEGLFENLSVVKIVTDKALLLMISTPIAVIVGLISHYFLNIAWMVGVAVGLILPWAILTQINRNYEVRYREDGKKAIEFLGAILEAGGTLEEWLHEVLPRLNGPLVPIFQRGIRNYSSSYTVEVFLEQLIKSCPDSYLQLFFSGLLHEQRNSGDMKKYTDEALNDLINQERFERIMKVQRVSGQRMLVYIAVFPLFLYMLFKDAIHYTMKMHPVMTIIFIVGMSGYVGFIWYGMRITKSKLI